MQSNLPYGFSFGDEFRPTPVKKLVIGYPRRSNQTIFQFDSTLNYKVKTILEAYSENKPVLVVDMPFWFQLRAQFCTTRRNTSQLARDLIHSYQFVASKELQEKRMALAGSIKETNLKGWSSSYCKYTTVHYFENFAAFLRFVLFYE